MTIPTTFVFEYEEYPVVVERTYEWYDEDETIQCAIDLYVAYPPCGCVELAAICYDLDGNVVDYEEFEVDSEELSEWWND